MGESDASAAGNEYEFNAAQNAVFEALASAMRQAGIAWTALAGVSVAVLAVTYTAMREHHVNPALLFGYALAVAMLFSLGVWNMNAARPVTEIVSTSGRDIRLLMEAMTRLQRIFAIQRTVASVAAVLLVASIAIDALEHWF